jgi:hypothetical protein
MDILDRARKLEQTARSNILRHARKLEEKIQQRLQGTYVGEEPLEIWRGIARDIESQIQPVKAGYVFPHRRIVVLICAAAREKREALQMAFESQKLEEDIRQVLRDSECDVPDDLTVSLKFTSRPGPQWRNPVFQVKYSRQPQRPSVEDRPVAEPPPRVAASLRVIRGTAARTTYPLVKDVTWIGRGGSTATARTNHANDVVFEDSEDPVNSTISRRHARIVYEPESQAYVLYDEASLRGTSIVRGGRTSRLASGPRGRRLASGDQIVLGKAVIEFR